eukprot:335281-Rhodomonas_salina.1
MRHDISVRTWDALPPYALSGTRIAYAVQGDSGVRVLDSAHGDTTAQGIAYGMPVPDTACQYWMARRKKG